MVAIVVPLHDSVTVVMEHYSKIEKIGEGMLFVKC